MTRLAKKTFVGSSGLTLIELLLATAIAAALAGALYASLSVVFRARASADEAVQSIRKNTLMMSFISADLEAAMIPNGVLAGSFVGESGSTVRGTGTDALTFYSVSMDVIPSPGIGDVKKIEYVCDTISGTNEFGLLRRVTTNLLAQETPDPAEEIICRNVTGFVLRYYDGTSWLDAWDSSSQDNVLPKAVEVTIEWDDDGQAKSLTQVVPIPAGQGVAATDSSTSGTSSNSSSSSGSSSSGSGRSSS